MTSRAAGPRPVGASVRSVPLSAPRRLAPAFSTPAFGWLYHLPRSRLRAHPTQGQRVRGRSQSYPWIIKTATDPATQAIERQLVTTIAVHELIDDDKVAGAEFIVPLEISFSLFGLTPQREFSKDSRGRTLGYHDKPFLTGLEDGVQGFSAL